MVLATHAACGAMCAEYLRHRQRVGRSSRISSGPEWAKSQWRLGQSDRSRNEQATHMESPDARQTTGSTSSSFTASKAATRRSA